MMHVGASVSMTHQSEFASTSASRSTALVLAPLRLLEEDEMSQTVDCPSKIGEVEFGNKFESQNIEETSREDQDADKPTQRKGYPRHTQHQIQEMETFFKHCPHPDDKQRQELSKRICLEPRQIKFWFQNKRTQLKNIQGRNENPLLKAENDTLREENLRYRQALSTSHCSKCSSPVELGEASRNKEKLLIENARLGEEVERISTIVAKHGRMPFTSPVSPPSTLTRSNRDLALGENLYAFHGTSCGEIITRQVGLTEVGKPRVVELAIAAMEELVLMAQMGEPLWTPQCDGEYEILCEEEYIRTFLQGIGPRVVGLKKEASRETGIVVTIATNLVEILMDVNRWCSIFSSIILRGSTVEVLSTSIEENYSGAMQVMSAEFQAPSPFVRTREYYFLRYCKKHSDGVWSVVDVSLDGSRENVTPLTLRCRRRPSGCLIQEMPNGYCKVTWMEHVEIDDRNVHRSVRQLVNSGLAFGAKRWIATLQRQCERLASMMACNIPPRDHGVISNLDGRKGMLKVAERMTNIFCAATSASTVHTWTTLSGTQTEDARVMIRKNIDDPGRLRGIILSAATSFWLPVSTKRVFGFLHDQNNRNEWDMLYNGGSVQEMAHISNGEDPGNSVSLLRVNNLSPAQSTMLILQESCTDAYGSLIVYAPVDISTVKDVLNGYNPDHVALSPSGVAILPDGSHAAINDGVSEGSILTVAFQILVDPVATVKPSLETVVHANNLISSTVERIKASLSCETV